ncbi:type II toxin-antitoxin system VapC family toxin [Chelatococcus sambhunathii]|uniref:Type II toxin-antitoxin system VapC family toxin n=1 Tax=Chelatococcus sambhunathii TaxID=363953 RepID=A0ABU1DFK9_9HYPH|nr:type II toxin-antitoxin system VapC family toxin [Chelatococcus sambhunathii]MDR4306914.1 type II toxin-antitoxin system VapC family toxin [Chelatococcus sambhunathii]
MIVIDASIALKWVVEEPGSEHAARLLELDEIFGAPDILFAEVANVLCKKVRGGMTSSRQAAVSLAELRRAIGRVGSTVALFDASLRLAIQLNHSAYDCFYLAMAGDGELVTADEAFVRKCRAADVKTMVRSAAEAIDARQ